MTGADVKRVTMNLELTRLHKSMSKMKVKLDTVEENLSSGTGSRAVGEVNRLESSKLTLEKALRKAMNKEEKLRTLLEVEMPTNLNSSEKEVPQQIESINVAPTFLLQDDIKYRVIDTCYKVVKVGKNGKDTKLVRYISKGVTE